MINIKIIKFRQALFLSIVIHCFIVFCSLFVLNTEDRIKHISIPVELLVDTSIEEKKEEIKKNISKAPKIDHKKHVKKKSDLKKIVSDKKKDSIKTIKKDNTKFNNDPLKLKKDETKITKRVRSRVKNSSKKPAFTSKISNLSDFEFKYYVRIIETKVRRSWNYPHDVIGDVKTVVFFKIARDGNLLECLIHEKSGNSNFDSIVLETINKAKPFPPLPVGYDKSYLGVYFEFEFKA